MKRDHDDDNLDRKFEWDMTVVILLFVAIVFVMFLALAIGPFGHLT